MRETLLDLNRYKKVRSLVRKDQVSCQIQCPAIQASYHDSTFCLLETWWPDTKVCAWSIWDLGLRKLIVLVTVCIQRCSMVSHASGYLWPCEVPRLNLVWPCDCFNQ